MRKKILSSIFVLVIAFSAANSQTVGDVLCGAQCASAQEACAAAENLDYDACLADCAFLNGGYLCYSACSYLTDDALERCADTFAACMLRCFILGSF